MTQIRGAEDLDQALAVGFAQREQGARDDKRKLALGKVAAAVAALHARDAEVGDVVDDLQREAEREAKLNAGGARRGIRLCDHRRPFHRGRGEGCGLPFINLENPVFEAVIDPSLQGARRENAGAMHILHLPELSPHAELGGDAE